MCNFGTSERIKPPGLLKKFSEQGDFIGNENIYLDSWDISIRGIQIHNIWLELNQH